MAAVPSIGRASLVEPSRVAPQAAATEGLYERHAAKLQSYCLHQLGSREEAEDAVQTTYMNAFRALGRGIVPEAESAWLFKIAENVCLSRRRSSWRRGRIESPSDFDDHRGDRSRPEPAERRADRDRGRARVDARAAAPCDPAARVAGPLLSRDRRAELEVTQSAVETLIFRARRSLAARSRAAGLGQEAEAEELPPRSAGVRLRHGCRCASRRLLDRRRGRQGDCRCRRGHSSCRSRSYGVDKIESKPPVRAAAPAKTLVSKPAPAAATSTRIATPSKSVRLASGPTPQRAVKPAAAKPASVRSRPAATAVVRHSAPLHYIPAEDTPLQAAPAEHARRPPSPLSIRLQLPWHRPRRSRRAQTRARTTAASETSSR